MAVLAGAALVQVAFQHASGLVRDNSVNTLAFDVSSAGTFSSWGPDLATMVANAYLAASGTNGALLNYYAPCIEGGTEVKVYDLGDTPPRQFHMTTFTMTPASVVTPYPNEVAVCLSFKTSQGTVTSRNRGRIYIGPLHGDRAAAKDLLGNAVPSAGIKSAALDLAKELYDGGEAIGMPWSIWSRAGNSLGHILSAWVDDAFDTQRRRGQAPTARITADLTS